MEIFFPWYSAEHNKQHISRKEYTFMSPSPPMATPISPRSFKRLVSISFIRFRWCVDMSFNCCSSDEVEFRSVWKRKRITVLMQKNQTMTQNTHFHYFNRHVNINKTAKFAKFNIFLLQFRLWWLWIQHRNLMTHELQQ